MKKISVIIVLALIMWSCINDSNPPSINQLLEVEQQFSDMSKEKGMIEAFNHFCDTEGVLLRPNSYPIVGNDSIAAYLSKIQDSQFTLSWVPSHAELSKSGELGYTYGIYTIAYSNGSLPESYGTYLTIWKKNTEGEWRFMLDTGQDGLEN